MAATKPLLRLGDLVPERRPIEITRNGETVVLYGYVVGKRCPGRVKAELASATDAHLEATRITLPDGSTGRKVSPHAWRDYLRDSVLALIEGLEFEEAEVLAGDEDAAISVLRYFDAWGDVEEASEASDESPPTGASS